MGAILDQWKGQSFPFLKNSPNIQILIEILCDPIQDLNDVCNFILDHTAIDDAEGEQLEQRGEKIGVARPPAQETKLFTICDKGEVLGPDYGFKIEQEMKVSFASSGFSSGDVGSYVVVDSGGVDVSRAKLTSFTSSTEIYITRDYGIFIPGQTLEKEGVPATNGVITAMDYFPNPALTYIGGYLGDNDGMAALDGSNMSDEDFRFLIKQKAASYRNKMTVELLFLYLVAFGGRCLINDDDSMIVEIDPIRYQDFDDWTRSYIEQRGFKPAGLTVKFRENMRDKDTI